MKRIVINVIVISASFIPMNAMHGDRINRINSMIMAAYPVNPRIYIRSLSISTSIEKHSNTIGFSIQQESMDKYIVNGPPSDYHEVGKGAIIYINNGKKQFVGQFVITGEIVHEVENRKMCGAENIDDILSRYKNNKELVRKQIFALLPVIGEFIGQRLEITGIDSNIDKYGSYCFSWKIQLRSSSNEKYEVIVEPIGNTITSIEEVT